MSSDAGVIILSTFSTEESILRIAKDLVNRKLCACVNFTKIRSIYSWKGKLEDQEEFLALFKTTKSSAKKLKAEIKKLHPYDVPEIAELKMSDVSKPYLSWLVQSTQRMA